MMYRNMLLSSTLLVSMAGMAAAQTGDGLDFDTVDADGDGFVTEAEVEAAFDVPGSDVTPTAIVEAHDEDGDGMISLQEAGADGRIYPLDDDDEDDDV